MRLPIWTFLAQISHWRAIGVIRISKSELVGFFRLRTIATTGVLVKQENDGLRGHAQNGAGNSPCGDPTGHQTPQQAYRFKLEKLIIPSSSASGRPIDQIGNIRRKSLPGRT
jgi:hypothetical protein